jgi:hypothetical protein
MGQVNGAVQLGIVPSCYRTRASLGLLAFTPDELSGENKGTFYRGAAPDGRS